MIDFGFAVLPLTLKDGTLNSLIFSSVDCVGRDFLVHPSRKLLFSPVK